MKDITTGCKRSIMCFCTHQSLAKNSSFIWFIININLGQDCSPFQSQKDMHNNFVFNFL